MKKISITANIETYLQETPLKVKHDLFVCFGGMEDLVEEVIFTLQNSIIDNKLDLRQTDHWLYTHASTTIEAIYAEEDDVSSEKIEHLARGFRNLCFDLHDAVIPHVAVRGYDISDINVSVDAVDTFGEMNGAVTDEITMYLTCTWEEGERIIPRLPTPPATRKQTGDTTFQIDEEQLYDWAPRKIHVFVRNTIVDIMVRFMKVGMRSPQLLHSRDSIGVYTIINQSLNEQIVILEEEIDTMDAHSYNQDTIETYYNYEDELKHDTNEMSSLIALIGNYLSDFFYNPSDLRAKIWKKIDSFKNVIVFRNKYGVSFRLIPK